MPVKKQGNGYKKGKKKKIEIKNERNETNEKSKREEKLCYSLKNQSEDVHGKINKKHYGLLSDWTKFHPLQVISWMSERSSNIHFPNMIW